MTQWAIEKDGEFRLRLDESSGDDLQVWRCLATVDRGPHIMLSFFRQTEAFGRYEHEPTVIDFLLNITPQTAYDIGSQLVEAAKALDESIECPAKEEGDD